MCDMCMRGGGRTTTDALLPSSGTQGFRYLAASMANTGVEESQRGRGLENGHPGRVRVACIR